jgi:hypothetical protein
MVNPDAPGGVGRVYPGAKAMPRTRGGTGEADLSRAVRDLLNAYGVFHLRTNSGGLRDRNGRHVPFVVGPDGKPFSGLGDVNAIFPPVGRWLSVEVKRPAVPAIGQRAGTLRPAQRDFLHRVNQAGGVGVCVDNLDTLRRVLEALAKRPLARFDIDGNELA